MKFVICGLSITSSWGNGHATTYRSLVKELCRLGHDVLFLERDQPLFEKYRDLAKPPHGRTEIYPSLEQLKSRFAREIRDADAVVVGSCVPDGVELGEWVTSRAHGVSVFYDIDTPVTLSKLRAGEFDYITPDLIQKYHLYLSSTGGPILKVIEDTLGSPMARPLYCSVDPDHYFPEPVPHRWDLGYLGTYSEDRQPALERLLIEPARQWGMGKFTVAGSQYPEEIEWPKNVERIPHLCPPEHRAFYTRQRFALNVTRKFMVDAGYSPNVRLFEAAACGTPMISDEWPGVGEFFSVDREIVIARTSQELLNRLKTTSDADRIELGRCAREKVLSTHTAAHRALELESYILNK